MGKRPNKQINIIDVDKKNDDKDLSHKKDVESFVKDFAISLKRDISQAQLLAKLASNDGTYQPLLSQQLLQEINFNPASASSDDISDWLLRPQVNDKKLRALSQYLENAVGQYNKAVHYYSDILSFNCELLPKDVNIDLYEEEDEKKYKDSYLKACDIVSRIRPKDRFPAISLSVMEDGVSFWWIDDTNNEISFLQLPTDYCYITSKWAMGWTGAIDLTYFDRFAYLDNVVPELQSAYKVFVEMRNKGMSGKSLEPYQYFALPVDKSWIFTFDPNKATKVPPLSDTFGASLDLISYRNLLKDKSALELWKVLAAKIPLRKNDSEMMMDYGEAADIVAMVQSTLPDNISIFATPFDVEPVTTNQVNTLDNIIDLSNNSFYSAMGTTGNFFGENDNDSAKAILLNQEIDFRYVSQSLYPQFNNMVDWMFVSRIQKYHWAVRFSGNNLTQREDIDKALKLVTIANFPMSTLASVCGYLPHELNGLTRLDNMFKVKENMKPLQSQFQSAGGVNKEGGSEKESDLDLSDEGEATRDSNGAT